MSKYRTKWGRGAAAAALVVAGMLVYSGWASAESISLDQGTPASEAGAEDQGVAEDQGAPADDAGPEVDQGEELPDGGIGTDAAPESDAGGEDPPEDDDGGCTMGAGHRPMASGGLLLLLGLGIVALAARRRS